MSTKLLELIRDLSNEGAKLTFEEDVWGGNTLTISIEHPSVNTHTHTGYPDAEFHQLSNATEKALEVFLGYIKEQKLLDSK